MGVYLVGLQAEGIGWIFREQPIEDQGIDGHLEMVEPLSIGSGLGYRRGTGRLIAVQIKTGESWFREQSPDGWWFRFDKLHADLWLNHSLPVVVMLVDLNSHTAYWQEISPRTVRSAGSSFKVEVPQTQVLTEGSCSFEVMASEGARVAVSRYDYSLEHLPPSVTSVFAALEEGNRGDAAMLALHLADSRSNPAGITSSLLATSPVWITRNERWAWRAIGNFAASHLQSRLAVQAFSRAGAAGGEDAGRCYAAAALHSLDFDREAAASFTTVAEDRGAATPIVASLRAVLAHREGDAGPIPMPVELETDTAEVRGSAIAQSYLYLQAKRRGDIEAALRHSQLMLEADPTDTAAMLGRADALAWSAAMGSSGARLLGDAVALLEDALRQRQSWSGPTAEITVALARAHLESGDFDRMLQTCLPAPAGTATVEDAEIREVRQLAVHAAVLLNRLDVVETLTQSDPTSTESQLARYRLGILDLTGPELEALLTAEFNEAAQREDYARIAHLALDLAERGVSVLARIRPYVERSIIQPTILALGEALLALHRNFEAGLPGLRALARSDRQSAEILVRHLQSRGRHREAADACEAILAQGEDALFAILRANALIDARDPDAEVEALEAVGRYGGFPTERARLLTFAAGEAADRDDWNVAERRLAEVLGLLVAPKASSVWNLVTAQLQVGRPERALQTVDRYRPEVRDDLDAKLWLQATAAEPWDDSRASEALTLASRVNDPQLSAALLQQIVLTTHGIGEDREVDPSLATIEDRRLLAQRAVPGELHRQAFEALEALVERHGDQVGVRVLHGETDDLLEQMTSMLRAGAERDRILLDLLKQVRDSALPMGLVANLSGKGYATLLVQRALGPLVTASADDDEYGVELSSASAAIDRQVVVDASSLLTVSGLEDTELLGHFTRVVVPAATLRDIHRAVHDIRSLAGSPGRMGWDPTERRVRISETSTEEFIRQLTRAEALDSYATSLPVGTPSRSELRDRLDDDGEFAAWLDPVQLAKEGGYSLWSDDLGLRRIAHAFEVDSFGTAALIDGLREREITRVNADQIEAVLSRSAEVVRRLGQDCLVDLPLGPHDLWLLGEQDEWHPSAGAVALSRASWWVWQNQASANPLHQLAEVLAAVAELRADSLPAWQMSALGGGGRAFVPDHASRGLCELALLARGPGSSDRDIVEGLMRARLIANELDISDPVDEISAAAAHLADGGLVDDPEDLARRVLAQVESDTDD
jgi:tetratricopeptide (TPR) repeat protein